MFLRRILQTGYGTKLPGNSKMDPNLRFIYLDLIINCLTSYLFAVTFLFLVKGRIEYFRKIFIIICNVVIFLLNMTDILVQAFPENQSGSFVSILGEIFFCITSLFIIVICYYDRSCLAQNLLPHPHEKPFYDYDNTR